MTYDIIARFNQKIGNGTKVSSFLNLSDPTPLLLMARKTCYAAYATQPSQRHK